MKTANYDLKLESGWFFHLGEVKRFRELNHEEIYLVCKAGGSLGDWSVFKNQNHWESVRIPHDWLTELPYDEDALVSCGYKTRETGWYYCCFHLGEEEIASARLVFEGVMGQSTIYVNGSLATRNFSGYNRFSCEIGDYLLPGSDNFIALYVDGRAWEGWWYEGAGLYRPVCIRFREELHFEQDDCFLRGECKDDLWFVRANLSISKGDRPWEGVKVRFRLVDPAGTLVAEAEIPAEDQVDFALPVANPRLWSPKSPFLYQLSCDLIRDGEVMDCVSKGIGMRKIEWTAENGMYLNGEAYPVKGICGHQDHGGLGVAVTEEILRYRVSLIKEMGVNAFRCAHHAPSEMFLQICDEMGLLVMAENRHYNVSEEVMAQLEAMVRLSRNHPCVFLYCILNEEPWQKEIRGFRMARKMRQRIRELDDTRAVTVAMNGGVVEDTNAGDAVDVIGANYHIRDYEAFRSRFPGKPILGTENAPTYATRGVYSTDKEKMLYANYGDEHLYSGSLEATMTNVENSPWVAGCFVWSAFDYYGEPEPHVWPAIMSHWGCMDICGFKKDIFYMLAAWYRQDLFAHLLPHWNWEPGKPVRVCVFTNGERAELFLNGRSLGGKPVSLKRAEWEVLFEPGELKVCVQRGDESVCDQVATAGAAKYLAVEDVTVSGEKNEIRILNMVALDAHGIPVPDYQKKVKIFAERGKILGVANGDPNGHQSLHDTEIDLFHGAAQVITTSDAAEGLRICCDELEIKKREVSLC